MTVTFNFSSSVTLTGVQVLTQGITGMDFVSAGGTCTATGYSSGQSCTVIVAFTPLASGLRMGAVVLVDSGSPVMTSYISGIGVGPQIAFNPVAQSTVGSGLNLPVTAVVDVAGNVYIGDGTTVITVPQGGGPQTSADYGRTIQGLAIDGAGNLYFSTDTTEGVLEARQGCTNQSCMVALAGGLGFVAGSLAVDGTGAVYAGEYHDNRVVKVPSGCANPTCIVDIADSTSALGGVSDPEAVAVDAAGNLYIGDAGNKRILEVPPGCASSSCQTTVASLFATGLAVDAAGNLYVISGFLQEIPAGTNTPITLLNTAALNSVALDRAGDLYIADASTKQVYKLGRVDAPTLSFGSQTVGTAGTQQTATVMNVGNSNLTFKGLALTPGDYSQQTSSGTDCSSTTTLAPAGQCSLQIVFTPGSVGAISGSATLTDNALINAAGTQVIQLTGTGAQAITTTALTSLTNPAALGATVTFTATLTTPSSLPPNGNVTFMDGTNALGTGAISTSNGSSSATLSTGTLSLGHHSITATYSGNSNFSGSTSPALDELIVKDSTTVAVNSSANPAFFGAIVTFTASVSTTTAGTPTGTVNFMDGATNLGTGTLDGNSHTMFATAALALGTHPISAIYSGDSNFAGSTSVIVSEIIDPPTVITVTPANNSVNIASGQSANIPLTISGNGTFSGLVTVTCKTQTISCLVPSTTSVSLTPSTITLTISAATAGATMLAPHLSFGDRVNFPSYRASLITLTGARHHSREIALALVLGIVFFVFALSALHLIIRRARDMRFEREPVLWAIGSMLLIVFLLSGCGGGGTSMGNKGVPAGSYSVTVTIVSGNVAGSAVINVSVQ